MMTKKNIVYLVLVVLSLIGYNAWLIQRDDKMFDAYYRQTAKENLCSSLSPSHFHPDCNVK